MISLWAPSEGSDVDVSSVPSLEPDPGPFAPDRAMRAHRSDDYRAEYGSGALDPDRSSGAASSEISRASFVGEPDELRVQTPLKGPVGMGGRSEPWSDIPVVLRQAHIRRLVAPASRRL